MSRVIRDGALDPQSTAPEALRFGRYVVLGRIGAWAMGVVYRAYDEALDRRVAVKLLNGRRASDNANRLRLQREAQALAQLSHPNVVQVYDVGEWRGQSFVALEFVEGQTVSAWLAKQPRRWTEILDVFTQAGRGAQDLANLSRPRAPRCSPGRPVLTRAPKFSLQNP